jgi:hypothetical protein
MARSWPLFEPLMDVITSGRKFQLPHSGGNRQPLSRLARVGHDAPVEAGQLVVDGGRRSLQVGWRTHLDMGSV